MSMKRPLAYNSVVHYVCRCIKPTCRYLCRFHVSILHKIKLFTKPMVQTMMIIILIMSQKVSTLGFASKVILRVPLIGAVTTTLPGHQSSSQVCFSGVRVARSVVFCVVFTRSLFVLFLFGHCVLCRS
jgi:hypothetical protein